MGINSENNNNTENLKQQENLASAVDGVTSSAQQLSNANTKVAASTRDMQDGIDSTADKLDKMQKGLDKTLKSIHLLPAAIEEYTKTANKNMAYASEKYQESFFKGVLNEKLWGFRAELGRETEELKQAMEASKESALQAIEHANKTGKEQDKQIAAAAQLRAQQLKTAYENRKNMKFSQQLNIKLARDMKTQLLEIGKKMFSELWGYAKKLLDDAYSKDKSTIEQNYDTIMSLNSYNRGEYAKLIDRLQEKIDASGLGDVISVNTLQENLTKTMQMGLQGALAESNAYYASIAEKAGITFDWYGTEWTNLISQMNRTGKDYEKVMKSVITTTDDLAEVYGDSTGLAGGRANQMMSAASTLGTTYGLSEEAIGNIYKSLAVTSQELTNYGIDSTNFVQDITGALESGLSNQDLGVIFGTGGASGAEVEAKIKAGKFDELMIQYMNNLESMYNGHNSEMVNALQGALGSSFSNTDYQAFQTYWEQEGSFSANFEKAMGASNSDIEDINGELKNYVTTQESYETKMENYLADIAEVMTQNPILEVISKTLQAGMSGILGYLGMWAGNQLLNKFLGGNTGNAGGLFNFGKSLRNSKLPDGFKLGKNGQLLELQASKGGSGPLRWMKSSKSVSDVTGGATKVGGLSKIGQFFNNGTAFASKGGTLAKVGSKVFSTGGKALGVVGSLISMGIDGYQGYKEDGVEGALRGALTGSGKAAESGWDVAKGAGSAALKGAGIGMVFGPWGAAIGAAVGGLAGLTVGLTDYLDVNKRAMATISKVDTSYKAMQKSLDDYNSEKQKLAETEANAMKLVEDATPSADILEKYPQLSVYLDENGKATETYTKLLNQLIEADKKANAAKLLNTNFDNLKKTSVSDLNKTGVALDNAADVSDSLKFLTENVGNVTNVTRDSVGGATVTFSDGTTQTYSKDQLTSAGVSNQDLIDFVADSGNTSASFQLESVDNYGNTTYSTTQATKGADRSTNATKVISGVSTANTKAQEYVETFFKNIENFYIPASEWFSTNGGLQTSGDTTEQWNTFQADAGNRWDTTIKNVISAYNAGFTNLKTYMQEHIDQLPLKFNGKEYKSFNEIASQYADLKPSELLTWVNNSTTANTTGGKLHYNAAFATGTDYVPYDNYLALLHRGEQVKTSAEVALEEANHVASTNTQSAIHDVVLNQTNTIINLLTNIYQVLSSGRTDPAKLSTKIKYDLPGAT